MRRHLPLLLLLALALFPLTTLARSMPHDTLTSEGIETIARTHLLENAAGYGVTRADMEDLSLQTLRTDPITGAHYAIFIQTVNGLPVQNAIVNVTLSADGEVVHVGNRAIAHLARRATNPVPVLSRSEAIARAATALGLDYTASTITPVEHIGGPTRELRFHGGDLSLETIPVKLRYQPIAGGDVRLVWDLNIYQQNGQQWWDVRIDATTGALLDRAEWGVHDEWGTKPSFSASRSDDTGTMGMSPDPSGQSGTIIEAATFLTGTYRVFPIPIESPSHATPPAPADGRDLVANPDNATASPFGWHDTDGISGPEFTTTQGNNAHAYTDTDADQLPDGGSSPDGGAGLLFDFPLDFTQHPSTYRPAAVSHYFYWTNLMHDIPYLYGFTEVAGNFQENNYGNGGLGSDYVYAESQDGSGTNGGIFFTPPDGSNPRMQMYIWTLTTPPRDGVFDNGVTAHEYGHGISNRLTGGPSNVSCLQNAEQMGEGWSDWQALALTMLPAHTATTPRGIGTYLLGQPPTGPGFRLAPYTTDFAVNDYTYADLPTAGGSHNVGFIWATMLWEMNWELIAAHGFNPDIYGAPTSGGNNLAYKLVQDGMVLQPCAPGFVDGRNAILAADTILTGGANQCRIWAAFARRGLGASASQGSPNSTADGTAAFNLPPECSSGNTPTPTPSPVPPSQTPTPTSTVSTATPTATGVPPTVTATTIASTATPTATNIPATATPTATGVPLTPTPTPTGVVSTVTTTPTATATDIPATLTASPTGTVAVPTPTGTATVVVSPMKLYLPSIVRD